MDVREGVESVVNISVTADITLKELRNGGAELFADRLRKRLEEELKFILEIPWSKVGIAQPAPKPTSNVVVAAPSEGT